jgi:ectoine hydroxylase-related dioxygenase (phytanoyl-CoA dioxygenase family)
MLTAEQIARYQTDGYLLVPGLLTPAEAATCRKACHDLVERLSKTTNLDATWGSAKVAVAEAEKTVVLHCHNVQFYDATLTKLLVDDRFTACAADLLGIPNIQLHHNKMFIKPPEKGAPFPMHQDQPYFPHARHTMTAAVFHFDDAPIEKGCLRVVPGSHLKGPLTHDPEGGWHLPFSEYPVESATPCEAKAGDVLFFNYLCIHGSGVNVSNEARTTLLVQFKDPEDPPLEDTHRSRGQGMMLRGLDPTTQYSGLE